MGFKQVTKVPICLFVLHRQFIGSNIISAVTVTEVTAFPGADHRVRQTYTPA